MWFVYLKKCLTSLVGGCFLSAFVFINLAYAQDPIITGSTTNVSAQTMLYNISQQIPNLMRLATAIAYVLGMFMMVRGIMILKHAGEMRMQMSHEHSIIKPIIYLVVGAMLTYLPSAVQVGLSTFWNDPNPYGYLNDQNEWFEFINVIFVIVQLVGVIAFIRGLNILSHLGGHGGHQGTFAKGLTHIIGGVLCINIYQFVQVIMVTLGLQPI